jgi:hypothetical protein
VNLRPTPRSWLRVRHAFAVFAIVAAPLAGLVWSMLVPLFTGSMADEVNNIAASSGRFVAGTYTGIVMSFLMVAAFLALNRLLRPVAPVASDVAAVLGGVGGCFHGALLVFQLAETAVIAAIPDRASATSVVVKLFEHPAFGLVLAPFFLYFVALAAFAVLLLTRRVVPWVIPVLILAAIPIEIATPILWKARLFFLLLAIAFAWLAVIVSRISADDWARRAQPVSPQPAAGA